METNFARNRTQLAKLCPCGKNNRDGKFAPSKENPEKGYCHSCTKWFDSESKEIVKQETQVLKPIDYHPSNLVGKSFKNENNKFLKFLKSKFDSKKVDEVFNLYKVGSSRHWEGATVFWQIDNLDRPRYGKIMLYNEETGKRIQEPFPHFTNIHTVLKLKDFNHKQCLFGLHLLPSNKKPIAIVESEKTAIIMSLVDESYLWLAVGGKGNFKYEVLEPLTGKEVFAFPDVGETIWNEISNRLNDTGFNITVSDALENKKFPKGYDLADVVLQQLAESPKEVIEPEPKTGIPATEEKQTKKEIDFASLNGGKVDNQQVNELERLKGGLQIDSSELSQLAKQIIPENDSRTQRELLISLNEIKGISGSDGKDLLLIMQMKQIIDYSKAGYYFLADSTPY
ncbi:DUF6371 domain-containing protein [Chryseobacterium turcicum]|uniref:DUF6371 domain-containing protein n=1 Tax=Chryseobacterium turcicum TaxID=2898076 RepID=A0A9Q3UZZ1_9FLAO|nr:DUF6371 domain-containing protein [Chryseobacterium turcicum]MCD1115607.1 DUF6371 domain-containing protein [Chryseobacterium turcicum]